jgi:hypothetical protein
VAVSCEHGNEASVSVKEREFVDQRKDYQLLKKDSASCSREWNIICDTLNSQAKFGLFHVDRTLFCRADCVTIAGVSSNSPLQHRRFLLCDASYSKRKCFLVCENVITWSAASQVKTGSVSRTTKYSVSLEFATVSENLGGYWHQPVALEAVQSV